MRDSLQRAAIFCMDCLLPLESYCPMRKSTGGWVFCFESKLSACAPIKASVSGCVHCQACQSSIIRFSCLLIPVSYTHLRAHETDSYLVCRLLLEKKKKT